MRLLRIQPPGSVLDHYTTVLGIQDANPVIDEVISTVFPTIDAFGSERIGQATSDEVLGALGGIELVHSAVPQGLVRQYLSMEFWHDDAVNRQLRPGRIVVDATVPPPGSFKFVAMDPSVSIAGDTGAGGGDNRLAVRNFTVGPGQNAAVRADAMAVGARITMRCVFVVFRLGAYTRSLF
jgi:hypothetical protein